MGEILLYGEGAYGSCFLEKDTDTIYKVGSIEEDLCFWEDFNLLAKDFADKHPTFNKHILEFRGSELIPVEYLAKMESLAGDRVVEGALALKSRLVRGKSIDYLVEDIKSEKDLKALIHAAVRFVQAFLDLHKETGILIDDAHCGNVIMNEEGELVLVDVGVYSVSKEALSLLRIKSRFWFLEEILYLDSCLESSLSGFKYDKETNIFSAEFFL